MSLCKTCESETCWNAGHDTYINKCSVFVSPKPVTNADRIRSMNDEELAEWLCDIAGWLPMYEGKMHPILDWLKEAVD